MSVGFFRDVATQGIPLFLSAVTIGELRQGVEAVRHRGDLAQATRLSRWLGTVTRDYADAVLPFDEEIAQIWSRLRVPHAENPLDKQIAATRAPQPPNLSRYVNELDRIEPLTGESPSRFGFENRD